MGSIQKLHEYQNRDVSCGIVIGIYFEALSVSPSFSTAILNAFRSDDLGKT